MKRYAIYNEYDPSQVPIGFVDIDESIPQEILCKSIIAPKILLKVDEEPKVVDFGMFERTRLDTRPREL